jgi:hypothetical protein
MAKNIGTLVTSPIRPNDSLDLIPSAFSNEIKGGHHSYATISERDAIIEERRDWGMLCTVYDDPTTALNGTYKLQYGLYDTVITNDNNWSRLTADPNKLDEWFSSVSDIVDNAPLVPIDGQRFLIATPSFGVFATRSGQVAEWNSLLNGGTGDWIYYTPTLGTTLRVDDEFNVIYKYDINANPVNLWIKEYLNQIRYINPVSDNGLTYSFTHSNTTPLDFYSYSIYYANFGTTNSGISELQIDGLGYYPIKKVSGNSQFDLDVNDLVPGIQYQLTWNSGFFQLVGFNAGASAGIIGDAEDLDYTDGLFTDFTPSTPIGVPIDRFNEILKALVPPSAPDIQSWSLGGPSFTTGKLSFDPTNADSFGLTAVPGSTIGTTYGPSGFQKGINSLYTQPKTTTTYFQDYTGILNNNISKGPGEPIAAYTTYSFGNGLTGSLVLSLNGTTVSSVDLSSTQSSIDTTSAGATSGFVLSSATNSFFPSGIPFNVFWNRTGTYLVKRDDPRLRPGYNYLDIKHILPATTLQLGTYSWVSDSSVSATSFTNPQLSISSGVPRYLSGIRFWTNVSITYTVDFQFHVQNTYNPNSILNAQCSIPNTSTNPNGINSKTTTTSTVVMGPPASKSITTPSSPTTVQNISWSFTLNNNVRRMNEGLSFSTSVVRTVQGTDTSSFLQRNNWYIDNYTTDPTFTVENFIKETYRLRNGSLKYDTTNDNITTYQTWNNQASLYSDTDHRNGLQVLNAQLVYPKFNYFNSGDGLTNPNFGQSDVNYSLCELLNFGLPITDLGASTNYRTYTRQFYLGTSNFTNARFTIVWDSTAFINSTTSLSGNNCWAEVKLPRNPSASPALVGGAITGWMDMTKPFIDSENWANGSGSLKGTRPTTSNSSWEVTFGSRGTVLSGGYILFRITAPSTWIGHISQITCIGISG